MENPSKAGRRPRRLVRRLLIGIGVALVAGPAPTPSARERATSSPGRSVGMPPWLEPDGVFPPPSSSGSTEVANGPWAHPAVHGKRIGRVEPLFPRQQQASEDRERERAMARHPAGKVQHRGRLVVKAGDSLWDIAEERVGLPRADQCWPAIYRANRDVIGSDPNHIVPGQRLYIPRTCR